MILLFNPKATDSGAAPLSMAFGSIIGNAKAITDGNLSCGYLVFR